MGSLSSGLENESRTRKPFPNERRPQMLKDFLRDDLGSCSSNGFRSIPRQACCSTVRNLVEMDLKARDSNRSGRVVRSRSKAASKTISAFQKASVVVINVVKRLPFSSVKAPPQSKSQTNQGIFPRSFSRRLRRSFSKKRDKVENYDIKEIKVRVLVKDIIRWKSFRDLIEEKQQQSLDFSPSPLHIAAKTATDDADATTITTNSSISSSDSNSNSWSDSDFTSEYLQSSGGSPEYSGENEGKEGKECSVEKNMTNSNGHNTVGEDSMETATHSVEPKGDCQNVEKEQFSPVSVLDFPDEEDDDDDGGETEMPSSFHQSLANMERKKQKLMQNIRRFESLAQLEPVDLDKRIVLLEKDDSDESSEGEEQEGEDELEAKMAEEKSIELLKLVKPTSSGNLDSVLLDFFKERIMGRINEGDYKELMKVGRDWMSDDMVLDLEYNRESYVTEMDNEGGRWRKFEEEQAELAAEVERLVLGSLVDELLVDLLS
ncbi:hypothetical protein NE237_013653 [Protea cynaroides]|uniref:DUF4378 domain-containing protein n=1 Tax=Protea cynaroides TaxID=273540 RepID=A0A9Q0K001_9MAGN|nr:hypothetical protein NE237_013653 [Protea cynaroides]